MPDLLYVAWNRLEMTEPSFESIISNTNWDQVGTLFIHDDDSEDGTAEYLEEAARRVPVDVRFHREHLGGPVAAMNWLLDQPGEDLFAKVDNDFVMCPGWLDALVETMAKHPEVDILGTEPMMGLGDDSRGYSAVEANHIGGKGLIRRSAFGNERMNADGRLGFTSWQEKHENVVKAWIAPDLKCFGLDQLPFEPWISLTEAYIAKGWQRGWSKYSPDADAYWSWWMERNSR